MTRDKFGSIEPWMSTDPLPEHGILFIRHGPRPKGSFPDHKVQLTEEGREEVFQLGMTWRGRESPLVLSSPVQRCKDTCDLLIEAAGWDSQIIETSLLGHPGPFVINEELIDMVVKKSYGTNNWSWLVDHVNGANIPGLRSRDLGVDRMLSNILFLIQDSPFAIGCSHDSILAALAASMGLSTERWPEPLEGYLLLR